MNYSDYLQTDYWKQVSAEVKRVAGWKCQICNSPHDLAAHHRTYDHRGNELEHLGDLICLCRRCHAIFHGKQDASQSPAPAVTQFQKPAKKAKKIHPVPWDNGVRVYLSKESAKRLRAFKEPYRWMMQNGFNPRAPGWRKRVVGQTVPECWLWPE